jgi:hypothetical protein
MNDSALSVLIPDGESTFAVSVLRCLSQVKNLAVHVLSDNPWSAIRFSRHCTRFFSCRPARSNEERLAAIDTVNVIEINPRFWGSLLGSLSAGINFPHLACLAALGQDLPQTRMRHVRFVAGTAAVRLAWQRLWNPTKIRLHFDKTGISFVLRDPLPETFAAFQRIYRSVRSKSGRRRR